MKLKKNKKLLNPILKSIINPMTNISLIIARPKINKI